MSSLIGVGTDFHGRAGKLDTLVRTLPYGTNIYLAGDMYGPAERTFTESIKKEISGKSNDDFETEYFKGIYEAGKSNAPSHKKFIKDSSNDTTKTIDSLLSRTVSHPVAGVIPGNGEVYHEEIWKSYSTDIKNPAQLFRESNLPYIESPIVHFYKNGERVERGENVDTAVILLPFTKTKNMDEKISKITGVAKEDYDKVQKAIYELIEENGVIDKIINANPKYIIQIQHEEPDSKNLARFFEPMPTENKELYSRAIKEITKLKSMKGSRLAKYVVLYGHIDKGARFKQKMDVDGTLVDTLHIDEGKEFVLVDTMTGKIYEPGEIPYSENSSILTEADLQSVDEGSLEEMVAAEESSESAE